MHKTGMRRRPSTGELLVDVGGIRPLNVPLEELLLDSPDDQSFFAPCAIQFRITQTAAGARLLANGICAPQGALETQSLQALAPRTVA